MHNGSQQIRLLKNPRFIPLRYRFIFMISGMLILLLGVLALVLGTIQRRTVQDQIARRGLGIAQSLAAACMADLSTYNYVALERSANQAAANPDITFVIIHDKEGRVAGYSGRPDLQNRFLTDGLSAQAVAGATPSIQKRPVEPGRAPVLDVAVPVFLSTTGMRWGTVRVGVSLVPMYRQIAQTRLTILWVGLAALSVGILVSIWAAHRVTSPLGNLVHATIQAARGNLEQPVSVKTGDEVEILAANFSLMIREILDHRIQLEQQLAEIRRLHRYTAKLLTAMGDGLMSINMDGTLAAINPAAHGILGVSEGRLHKGVLLSEALGEDSDLYGYVRDMLRHPTSARPRELRIGQGDESQVLLVGASLLADDDGSPREIILNLHDITALKTLEARIRQSERLAALGTMAAGLSHEIRNPLSAIKTFVQLLPRKIDTPGFLEKFHRTVPREINRINQLIENLLDMARPPKYHFETTDIGSLLKETLELLEAELQARGIHCRCRLSADLPVVSADAAQLVKAFHNIIQNAAQAMPAGGELSLEACHHHWAPPHRTNNRNGWVRIIFQDTGPGIPEDVIPHIFNPFFTTRDSGTGLGLSITHKVITEHGGSIEVSRRAGAGTRFTIDLPVPEG